METKKLYQAKIEGYIKRLSDVRYVGQLLFVIIVLLISWSGVKSIQTNYGLQKQITTIKNQNTLQQMQNENMALQNDYYHSKQYLELAARQNFGLAMPGEKLVIVPREVALANTVDIAVVSEESAAKKKQPGYQRNFQSWIDFFLHRQGSD